MQLEMRGVGGRLFQSLLGVWRAIHLRALAGQFATMSIDSRTLLLGGADHGVQLPVEANDTGHYVCATDSSIYVLDKRRKGPRVAFPQGFTDSDKEEALDRWFKPLLP